MKQLCRNQNRTGLAPRLHTRMGSARGPRAESGGPPDFGPAHFRCTSATAGGQSVGKHAEDQYDEDFGGPPKSARQRRALPITYEIRGLEHQAGVESGAEATALSRNAGPERLASVPGPREASGLRRVHRRFWGAPACGTCRAIAPILALITGLVFSGCAVGPDYERPALSAPAAYAHASAATTNPSTATLDQWWKVFRDPVLDDLIGEVQQTNLDLRLARARVREARALRGVSRSSFFPQLSVEGSYTRSRMSKHTQIGKAISATGQPLENDLFDGSFDMNWEVDIFGGRRRANEAAQAELEATEDAGSNLLVSVLAETGLNYFELRSAQEQLKITRANLQAQERILSLVRDRFNAGIASELDVSRQEGQVADLRAQISPLEEQEHRAIHRLSVLAGQTPNALEVRLLVASDLPSAVPGVPVGLPSDLLNQRPDVRQAERELAAATARIGEAKADLYPRFFLTGAAGLQSIKASDFIDGGSRYWSLGPGIRWPIFTAGRIRQTVHVENAREEQAVVRYEQTFLNALEEVENALVAFGKEQDRYQSLKDAEVARRHSLDLADQQYRSGVLGFLEVLETEKSLHASESQRARSEAALCGDLVRLYKALGGGWTPPAPESPQFSDVSPHSLRKSDSIPVGEK